ncbi:MAG: S8 family serine peptidase [Mycobacteriales bacterium]|nr:S8 family serine peptidase [Mycobacteriales bacterium]
MLITRRSALTVLALSLTGLLGTPAPATASPVATWIVTYDAPPSPVDLQVLGSLSDAVHGFTKVPAAVVNVPSALVPLLRRLPGVRGVWANETYQPLLAGATTASRARKVWDELGWTGAGVGIAVIDAGVDGSHPDLCAQPVFCRGTAVKVVQNVKVLGRQDVVGDPVVYLEDQVSTDSTSGHGSHVAGIAAGFGTASETPGKYRGVAHGASIVGYGTGELVEAVNVLGAYDHAIAHAAEYGIKVINNSWGPGAFTNYDPEHPVNRATDAAWAAGINVVFGSGNDGTRTDSLNMFSAHPKAISVAGGRKDGQQAFFSSKGVPGSPLWHPTLTAPGESISSVRALTGFTITVADAGVAVDGGDAPTGTDQAYYARSSGTSMAAPHVAGVIALVQQAAHSSRGTWLTPLEVRNLLQNTARPMMPSYQHYSAGAGYVDAFAAATAAAAGTHLGAYDDGTTYDTQAYAGTVGPAALVSTSTFESTFAVAPGARSLDVMADWGPEAVVPANQDLDIDLFRPDGTLFRGTFLVCDPAQQPNGYSSFCSSAPNERLTVTDPVPGTWRVVVKGGLATASETVRGLWSAAYPDGTPVPARPGATSVSTVPATPAGVAGQGVLVTATVRDAAGLPVANAPVTWSSTGIGAVTHAEPVTDSFGRAVATAGAGSLGAQTVTATTGALSGSGAITWLGLPVLPAPTEPCVLSCPPPPAADTAGEVSGGGWWQQGTKRHLTVGASNETGSSAPSGELRYDDKAGTVLRATLVERFRVDGGTATLSGSGTVNGTDGYRWTLTVTDGGQDDSASLVITQAGSSYRHEAGGTLGGGNLTVTAG